MIRTLLLIISVIVGSASLSSSAWSSPWPDKYDLQIRQAVNRYWPDFPHWLAWKAQLFAESGLNPNAESYVGAQGIAQFMPRTWAEVSADLHFGNVSPYVAQYAIQAGAYYIVKLKLRFEPGVNAPDDGQGRHKLAVASYNAGAGNILRAQRVCGGALSWDEIAGCLPRVTGHHAEETIGYVDRIWRLWKRMEAEQ